MNMMDNGYLWLTAKKVATIQLSAAKSCFTIKAWTQFCAQWWHPKWRAIRHMCARLARFPKGLRWCCDLEALGYDTSKGRIQKITTGSGVAIVREIAVEKLRIGANYVLDDVKVYAHDFPDESFSTGVIGLNVLSQFDILLKISSRIINIAKLRTDGRDWGWKGFGQSVETRTTFVERLYH